MIERRKNIGLSLLLCFVLYLLVGYFIAVAICISELGVSEGKDFVISHIATVLRALFLGDSNNSVLADVHDMFFNPWVQLFFLAYVVFVVGKAFMTRQSIDKKEAPEYGSHGTARWATKQEIKERFTRDEKGIVLGQMDGMKLIYPVTNGQNRHVVVFGGSRSGKSTSLVIPNVFEISRNLQEHLVIADPKGEIYNFTSPTLVEMGYEIKVLNLFDTKKSDRYNPMDYVRNSKDAKTLANTIIQNTSDQNRKGNDDFWERAEKSLISALILYIKETRPKVEHHLRNVLELGLSFGDDPDKADKLFEKLPKDSPARMAYRIFNQSEDKLRSSILTGFGVRFDLWTEPEIVELTARSDIDLKQFGSKDKKIALFIMSPSQDETFDVLPAMLIDQVFQELFNKASRLPGNRLEVPVTMLLDELANIAPISNLKRKVATMGGLGISVFLIFQSKYQFEDRYGKAVASEIIDSCDTRLLLGTNDPDTQKYFSDLLGTTTIQIDSLSESKNGNGESMGRNRNFIGRSLMTPDEVGRLKKDELIIFQRGNFPVLAKKNFMFKWKEWERIPKTHWVNIPNRSVKEKAVLINLEELVEEQRESAREQRESASEHPKSQKEGSGFIDNLIGSK